LTIRKGEMGGISVYGKGQLVLGINKNNGGKGEGGGNLPCRRASGPTKSVNGSDGSIGIPVTFRRRGGIKGKGKRLFFKQK